MFMRVQGLDPSEESLCGYFRPVAHHLRHTRHASPEQGSQGRPPSGTLDFGHWLWHKPLRKSKSTPALTNPLIYANSYPMSTPLQPGCKRLHWHMRAED
eukprot:365253-Chlamydomonas_euryale.AAC.24